MIAAGLGLATAIAVPVAWQATRPAASAGVAVAPALPTAPAPATTGPRAGEQVRARTAVPAKRKRSAQTAAPTRIAIPDLGVDAPIDAVGVTGDGSMSIPENVARVGWYRYGAAPGKAGSTVLAGHVDSAEQGRGAMYRLREADVGDRVAVTLADGTVTRYRVTGKETITKRRLPTERLFTRSGTERVVMITCGGPFLEELSSYRDNLVVVAEPEG